MKSEQRKKEDRELIYDLLSFFDSIESYTFNDVKIEFDDFIKDRNLEAKPKLELNRWIVDDTKDKWMIYLDGEDGRYYCIDSNGKWIFKEHSIISNAKTIDNYSEHSRFRYAANEEIFERLSNIAVKMGYKERQSECLDESNTVDNVNLSDSFFALSKDDSLWIISDSPRKLNCIFKNGKWAKFIETDTERIERLEKRVKELENKNK